MGRMDRIKEKLASTIQELSNNIETSQKNERIPADYSLGFANGVIFFEHMLNMRPGTPKYFTRTTSIGKLPVPLALITADEILTERAAPGRRDRIRALGIHKDTICEIAADIISSFDAAEEFSKNGGSPGEKFFSDLDSKLISLKRAVAEYKKLKTHHEEAMKYENERVAKAKAESESLLHPEAQADAAGTGETGPTNEAPQSSGDVSEASDISETPAD